jgi:FAD dependent oxidoreductase
MAFNRPGNVRSINLLLRGSCKVFLIYILVLAAVGERLNHVEAWAVVSRCIPATNFFVNVPRNSFHNLQAVSVSDFQSLSPKRIRRSNVAAFASPITSPSKNPSNHQQRDIVIIGGGLAGLSTALYIKQIDPSRHVTIYDKESYFQTKEAGKRSTVASMAAAGMLAPQSERLPSGELLELGLASRRMYREFCDLVETLARTAVSHEDHEACSFLQQDDPTDGLQPWEVGYLASGGFLAPVSFANQLIPAIY